jgi:hypothetical protein
MYSEHGQGNIDCSNNDVRYLVTFGKSLVVKDHEWFSMKHCRVSSITLLIGTGLTWTHISGDLISRYRTCFLNL